MAMQSPLGNRATSIIDILQDIASGSQNTVQPQQSPNPTYRQLYQMNQAQAPMGQPGVVTTIPAIPNNKPALESGFTQPKPLPDMASEPAPEVGSSLAKPARMGEHPLYGAYPENVQAGGKDKLIQMKAATQLTEQAAKGENPDEKPGFGEQVKNFFGNEENMLRLAMAFNTMRMEPDQQLAAYAAKRLETLQARKMSAEFAPLLAKNPELQGLVAAGAITAKDALSLMYKNPTQLSQMMDLYKKNPAQFKELAKAGAFGGQVDQGQGKWMDEQAKSVIGRADVIREAGTQSRNYMNQISRFESIFEGAETGPYEQRMQALREFGASIGMDVNDVKLGQGQSLNAAAFDMIAQQLRMNKGPQTDFDAEFTSRFLPSLGNTEEANRQIINYLKSVNLLQGIYGNMVTGLSEDFGEARGTVSSTERLSMNTPAVANINGQWVQFSEVYEAGRARGMSPEEILEDWRQDTGAR